MHKTPRAHEITDRLSFFHFTITHNSLSTLARLFVTFFVFFVQQSLSSGTIRRNALDAAATSAHTGGSCTWERDNGQRSTLEHKQHREEQALLHRSTARVILKKKTPAPDRRRPEDRLFPRAHAEETAVHTVLRFMLMVPRGRDQHHYPPPPELMRRFISRNS